MLTILVFGVVLVTFQSYKSNARQMHECGFSCLIIYYMNEGVTFRDC